MTCFSDFICGALSAIGAHIARNSGAYGTASIAGGLAVAKNIPSQIPKTLQELWTWMRNSIQTALPISRSSGPDPTVPVVPSVK